MHRGWGQQDEVFVLIVDLNFMELGCREELKRLRSLVTQLVTLARVLKVKLYKIQLVIIALRLLPPRPLISKQLLKVVY